MTMAPPVILLMSHFAGLLQYSHRLLYTILIEADLFSATRITVLVSFDLPVLCLAFV